MSHTEDSEMHEPRDPHYTCECHEREGNDFCGPAYCKRPQGCERLQDHIARTGRRFVAEGEDDVEDSRIYPTGKPAFDADWWFEAEPEATGIQFEKGKIKAVEVTHRVGNVSVTVRTEFE